MNVNKIYQWSRAKLFPDWINSIITIIIISAFVKFVPMLLDWLFFEATLEDHPYWGGLVLLGDLGVVLAEKG